LFGSAADVDDEWSSLMVLDIAGDQLRERAAEESSNCRRRLRFHSTAAAHPGGVGQVHS